MRTALIGATGFVGSNLRNQYAFDDFFRRADIQEISKKPYNMAVCAGAPGVKWKANADPDGDRQEIDRLVGALRSARIGTLVLISTIDVYPSPNGVNETSPVDPSANHPYGRHRYELETFVRDAFSNHLIVRLPALFGAGIKKNVIFDLIEDHQTDKINPLAQFQYYCLDQLWNDLMKALALGLETLNLSTAPIKTAEIVKAFFPERKIGPPQEPAAFYDMQSVHASLWPTTGKNGYLYTSDCVMEWLELFLQQCKRDRYQPNRNQ
ncbi:MAG TPA: NAD(P)-dependent oxidoreductase [Chthoniobacterales bacterium]